MNLRQYLEEQLTEDFKLLKALEDRLRGETHPRRSLELKTDRDAVFQRIQERQAELEKLEQALEQRAIAPILPLRLRLPVRIGEMRRMCRCFWARGGVGVARAVGNGRSLSHRGNSGHGGDRQNRAVPEAGARRHWQNRFIPEAGAGHPGEFRLHYLAQVAERTAADGYFKGCDRTILGLSGS
ncbi:hypothetical protein HC928_23120 [bacterium]|nr:hypothetical protein [bacterium]